MENWARNVAVAPTEECGPATILELRTIVSGLFRSHRRARAIGGGWSFTDVMASTDVLINTRPLRGIVAFSKGSEVWGHRMPSAPRDRLAPEWPLILSTALNEAVRSSGRRFAHVLAGTNIRELYLALDSPAGYPGGAPGDDRPGRTPWMLPTKVGLSGQTLAGALSTGSHGGDFNLPPLADHVRAIHLVGHDGELHWIERPGARSITDPEKMKRSAPIAGTPSMAWPHNIHYDDAWFDAALVSVGSMGILASLILEVDEQYGISERSLDTTWSDIRPMLASGALFTSTQFSARDPARRWIDLHDPAPDRAPRGLGIAINPYRLSDDYSAAASPDRGCRLSTQAQSAGYEGERHWTDVEHLELRFMDLIRRFEAGGLRMAREAIHTFLDLWNGLEGTGGKYRKSYTVWDPARIWQRGEFPDKRLFLSQEIAVSTIGGNHVRCVDRLLAIFDELVRTLPEGAKCAGAIFLRFTRPSAALLGMQHSAAARPDERFCYIEVLVAKEIDIFGNVHAGHHNMENLTEHWLRRFEAAAGAFGGRMHWGQLNHMTRAVVERDYPDSLPVWRRVMTAIAEAGRADLFSSSFSRRCGLEAYTEVMAACSWGANRYDVFSFNEKGDVLQLWWDGRWHWSTLDNGFATDPSHVQERFLGPLTATSWGPDRIDVFGLGRRGGILQLWWQGGWHWTDLGQAMPAAFPRDAALLGPMAATAPGPGRIELFALGANGKVWRYWFDAHGWHSHDLGNGFASGERFTGTISAASWGPGRVDVFGLGTQGQVLQLWREGDESAAWNWSDLRDRFPPERVRIAGPLAATATAPNRIDIFCMGESGSVRRLFFDSGWADEEYMPAFPGRVIRVGSPHEFGETPDINQWFRYDARRSAVERFTGPLAVASWGGRRIDVFGFGESGNVLQLWRDFDGAPWAWSDLDNGWARNADMLVTSLDIQIRTGDDDLRVDGNGTSRAFGFVRLAGGGEASADLNRGAAWPNYSVNTATLALPAPTRLGDIASFGIRFASGGSLGINADNWRIEEVKVWFKGPQASGILLHRCGAPALWYFQKNSNQVWEVPASWART